MQDEFMVRREMAYQYHAVVVLSRSSYLDMMMFCCLGQFDAKVGRPKLASGVQGGI